MTFLATFTGSMAPWFTEGADRRRELSDRCGEVSSADASPRRYHYLGNLGNHRGRAEFSSFAPPALSSSCHKRHRVGDRSWGEFRC